MTTPRKYATPGALRIALEDRLKRIAGEEGIDLQRLRRQVAFDRLLARLFSKEETQWVLKGGYAMELRLREARTTKDIDLTLHDHRLYSKDEFTVKDTVRLELQDRTAVDLGDFFVFLIGEPVMDLDGAPYGGARYPVDARLDGRTFVKFHVDVGIGDVILEPLEVIETRDWLAFAGIVPPKVPLISREQQFTEKLHAYTLPDRPAPNSRVKDLVDIALLIESGEMNPERVRSALRATFSRRKTHPIPERLEKPPENGGKPFAALASECGLKKNLGEAFEVLDIFFSECVEIF